MEAAGGWKTSMGRHRLRMRDVVKRGEGGRGCGGGHNGQDIVAEEDLSGHSQ